MQYGTVVVPQQKRLIRNGRHGRWVAAWASVIPLLIVTAAYGQAEVDIPEDGPEWVAAPRAPWVADEALARRLQEEVFFPESYCLAWADPAYSPTHSQNQGGYKTCWAHAVVHALEIETKRKLMAPADRGGYYLPYSQFSVNLSERQLIENCAHEYWSISPYDGGGTTAFYAANRMARHDWVIPLEGDNCYSCSGNMTLTEGLNDYIEPADCDFNRITSAGSSHGGVELRAETFLYYVKEDLQDRTINGWFPRADVGVGIMYTPTGSRSHPCANPHGATARRDVKNHTPEY